MDGDEADEGMLRVCFGVKERSVYEDECMWFEGVVGGLKELFSEAELLSKLGRFKCKCSREP